MPSYSPPPRHHLSRRTFVGAGAVLGVTAMSGTPTATAAPTTLDRAAGVARLGDTVHILGRTRRGWFRVGADGSARPTRGLGDAELNSLSSTGDVLLAVGADRTVPAIWESTDGLSWRQAVRLDGVDGHLTASGTHGGTAIAVGARLTLERVPRQRIVVRRSDRGWTTVSTRGLEYTDELTATAVGGSPSGWVLATVDANGSLLARSADGLTWTPDLRLVDTAVKSFDDGDWVANAMSGSAALTGPRRAAARAEGQAIGLLGDRSYWLADGRIVTATA